MTPQKCVDALFEQVVVLTRLWHLHALAERFRGRRKMSKHEALVHAAELRDLGYSWGRNTKPLADGIVPEAAHRLHEELAPIATDAIEKNDRKKQAIVLDAYDCLLIKCRAMGLTPHASQVAEAYLARELQRLARHERECGLADAPASQLVSDVPRLAKLAREYGIDAVETGAVDRWRKRLANHAT